MLLEMIRREIPIDVVLNVDTGMEFPAMYDHINQVEEFLLAERGIRLTRLRAEKTFEELMFDAVRDAEQGGGKGYGWPCAVVRWCTGQLKVHLILSFVKTLSQTPFHYIAFAADEIKRLERINNQAPHRRYPLIDWGITEAQALEGCYRAGYTWDGLYEDFSRVSCWCCPLQSLEELRVLRAHYPELWTELRRLDDRAIAQFGRDNPYGQFRKKESVRMLELRFDFEKEWASHGWSIRSKAFYRALNLLYQKHFPSPGDPLEELLSFVTQDDLQMLSLIEQRPKRKRKQREPGPLR